MDEHPAQTEALFSALFQLRHHKLSPKPINGIRPGEMMLLFQLFEQSFQPGEGRQGMTVSELSAAFGATAAAVTQHVNPLERAGYLARMSDPSDRRVVRVCLTEKGRRQMEEIRAYMLRDVSSLAAFLGPKDTADFVRILDRIREYQTEKRAGNPIKRRKKPC
ncbi:MAG: MarR family transcriptional regulator [Clostridiales bacterium]|nr:MarR family transcriptional regulator [Clostridiales bacterium]